MRQRCLEASQQMDVEIDAKIAEFPRDRSKDFSDLSFKRHLA